MSTKGALVTNIPDIPAALTAVMKLNGVELDFAPTGSLALKPWIANDQGIKLPTQLAMPVVSAPEPYADQIVTLGKQIGAVIARQNMKDRSGASVMDPRTQVTSVHGYWVLDMALERLEAMFALPLVHEIAWGPLMRKRISRLTAETLPWYLRLYGVMVGAMITGEHHRSGSLHGVPREERFARWTMADVCYLAMTGKKPTESEALPLQILVGLLISNGPGAISAQGAKGAVAADGPQTPERVQINKAMARSFAQHYLQEKREAKERGSEVRALFEIGASLYVFCVNVDAIIAALLLAALWKDYRSGSLSSRDLETAA